MIVISFSGSNIKLNINTYDTETYSVSSFIQEDSTQTYGMNIMNPQLGINQAYIFSLVITDTQAVSTNYFNTQDIDACVVRLCNENCSFAAVTSLGNGCISTYTSPDQGLAGSSLLDKCGPSFGGDYGKCYNCSSSCSPNTCKFINNQVLCESLTQKECSVGFYSFNYTYLLCNSDCYNCTNSLTCSICKDSHASPETLGCKCNSGYYNTSSLTENGSCLTCSSDCSTCTNSSTCSICKDSHSLAGAFGCNCISGYYNTSSLIENGSCLQCSSDCSSCTNSSTCSICKDPNAIAKLNGCACLSGYYNDSSKNTCLSCNNSCSTCDNPTTCLQCKDPNSQLINSECFCKDFFEIKQSVCVECTKIWNNTTKTCNCPNLCTDCLGNLCTSCVPNASLHGNKCLCNISFYGTTSCVFFDFTLSVTLNSENSLLLSFLDEPQTILTQKSISIAVSNLAEYSYNLIQYSISSYKINITYSQDIGKNCTIFLKFLSPIYSIHNGNLTTLEYYFNLPATVLDYNAALSYQSEQTAATTTQGITIGSVSLSILNLNFVTL